MDTEKVLPANRGVSGIEFSADKLLWCRHSHTRTQARYRLGTNYLQLPINRPRVPVNNDQRDGSMQTREFSRNVNYEPGSLDPDAPVEAIAGNPYAHRIEGEVTRRKIRLTDDFTQAGMRYRSFSKMDRGHLVDNLVADLLNIDRTIRQRVVGNRTNADPALGRLVARGLKL
ncbi:MAG: catalase [Candidatus Methanogaster sp.]|nr:MAG: catalase [ANME-2 cluster archaeon]